MRSSFFWDVTQLRLAVTDVSYNLSVPSSSGMQSSWTAIFALNGINQLVFVMEMQFVFCEVVIELLRVHVAGLTGESHCGSPGSILASLFDICCGQSGTGTGSSVRNSVFTCHYHSGSDKHPYFMFK